MQHANEDTISVIVPCFNEEESIKPFCDEVGRVFQSGVLKFVNLEILFVDDGSSDNTLNVIKEIAFTNDSVSYLSFSRNFGKEAAIYAGLENATGDYCALLDADLQDPPHLLEQMYLAIKNEGYDCVATKRVSRKGEPVIRSYFAKQFYRLINSISKTKIVDGARDFRLMTRVMADSIVSMREYNRFSKGLFSWVGFNVKWLSYENVPRVAGKSKWSFWSLLLYSIDGILAFSVVPLAFVSFAGVLIFILSILGVIAITVRTLIYGDPVPGWPSLATIVSFLGGLQLVSLGIIGQYLSKTYLEAKNRPVYLIKEYYKRKEDVNGPDRKNREPLSPSLGTVTRI
ncbi:Bactoprenol glucosyl transferase [Chitinispirillum alkaliphilum]|nr:Bactoprenol glucosyl transferase [Chitinispirillum alkaliphilum]